MDQKKFDAIRESAKARIAARNVVKEGAVAIGEMNTYETPEQLVKKLTQKSS